ncbi:pyrroloquinoline quinone biosynthesis protein PqqF [Pseudomonas sp. 5P_3.1_Bac2]|uniref:pyrroloquinoline quinone biosynthesis protein PqqF n=1 Tax=Pseudomonas sp. 5P_3.1_Bac2 TaxID=2971617 RepID=UPI0021C7A26A|nr:pyrroloquinoline quinone biosynthesis protein PqqF [Pseudomonas sp. 5P_3.1_Bac2]MCU1716816.1 pyrroloquinoline quinone biosynthesis protein PqqF [Pseudomonas sp. 5P_3.1_Bac2]
MSIATASTTAPDLQATRRLANGVRLQVQSQPWLSSAAICVRVNAGSHDEPLAYPGLAHFLEHLLFLDCAEFTGEQRLLPFIQACGGQVNATTQARYTEYFCQLPPLHLAAGLARLLAMLAQPGLSTAEQLREREVLHAEFLARSQDRETLLLTALGQALPKGHRGADFVAGNKPSLPVPELPFQQALHEFHRRFYSAANCQLSLIGPQPLAELLHLAQQHAAVLPGATLARAVAVKGALLPLRFNQARISLPGACQGLHVGLALELEQSQADAAWQCLHDWLLADGAGCWASLAGQGAGAQLHSLYSHQGQQLWLLSLPQAHEPGRVLAALQKWAGIMAQRADLPQLLAEQQAARAYQLASRSPLALARLAAQQLSGEGQPCALATLQLLLKQLQCASRTLCLRETEGAALWPNAGFPLHMQVEPRAPLPAIALPAIAPPDIALTEPPRLGNPLLTAQPSLRLPCSAQLRWLSAPAQEHCRPLAQAIWYGRWRFAQSLCARALKQLAEACCAGLMQQAGQLGISLQIGAEAGCLLLRIDGARQLLPSVISQLMQALYAPSSEHWQAPQQAAAAASGMPIRHLLKHIELLLAVNQGVDFERQSWPMLLSTLQVEGLGIGFDSAAQEQISALFQVGKPAPAAPLTPLQAGVHWRHLAASGEAAVLLFCPQPSASAVDEAAWRLLAQLQQNAFYQRMRSELQLGYAVFCQYRQISGQRGLLFGLQAPQLSSSEILAQIQLFLQQRSLWLAQLPASALEAARDSLSQQWREQAQSLDGLIEQHWQAHLAGLPAEHDTAVQQQILSLPASTLLAAQHGLCQAQAGWYVLSNQAV